jgi:hypothetical protein
MKRTAAMAWCRESANCVRQRTEPRMAFAYAVFAPVAHVKPNWLTRGHLDAIRTTIFPLLTKDFP